MTKELEATVLQIVAKIEKLKLVNELTYMFEGKSMPVEVYEFIQKHTRVEN